MDLEKIENGISERFEKVSKDFLIKFKNIPGGIENHIKKLELAIFFLDNDFIEFTTKELSQFTEGSEKFKFAEEVIGKLYFKIHSMAVIGE